MSHPFEPPTLERGPVVKPWLLVVGSWSLAGACVGTAVGATLQLTRGWHASAELGLTLKAARRLRDTLKRSPTPEEIAKEAGITLTSVRCALLFARILQR